MTGDPFNALPAYFGGKRRLTRPIFALLDRRIERAGWSMLTFVDPFLGGGSVSLEAKRLGFQVQCNDLALRSAVVGRALIENSSVRINDADLAVLLCQPAEAYPHIAETRYSPSVLPRTHAMLLDRALHNLCYFGEPTRSLMILLIIKWTLRVQPMSMLRGTDARAAYEGDLDRVSPRRLGHYLAADKLLTAAAWRRLAADVNAGIFPGTGTVSQCDAIEFLRSIEGDIVYLDPPYPGTASYEKEYAVLDDLLEGTTREVSAYSRSPAALPALFEACAHIPTWIVSLNNAVLTLDQLEALIRPHRPNLQSIEVPYRHLASIATEGKNEKNREYLVTATA